MADETEIIDRCLFVHRSWIRDLNFSYLSATVPWKASRNIRRQWYVHFVRSIIKYYTFICIFLKFVSIVIDRLHGMKGSPLIKIFPPEGGVRSNNLVTYLELIKGICIIFDHEHRAIPWTLRQWIGCCTLARPPWRSGKRFVFAVIAISFSCLCFVCTCWSIGHRNKQSWPKGLKMTKQVSGGKMHKERIIATHNF